MNSYLFLFGLPVVTAILLFLGIIILERGLGDKIAQIYQSFVLRAKNSRILSWLNKHVVLKAQAYWLLWFKTVKKVQTTLKALAIKVYGLASSTGKTVVVD